MNLPPTGLVPRKLMVVFRPSEVFNGTTGNSPFNFINANIRDIQLMVNGRFIPNTPYALDFPKNIFSRFFHDFNANWDLAFANDCSIIDYEKYKNGFTIFYFNLANIDGSDDMFDLLENGPVVLNIKFKLRVQAGGLTMLLYAKQESIITIDANRTVATDQTA